MNSYVENLIIKYEKKLIDSEINKELISHFVKDLKQIKRNQAKLDNLLHEGKTKSNEKISNDPRPPVYPKPQKT